MEKKILIFCFSGFFYKTLNAKKVILKLHFADDRRIASE